MFTRRMYGPEGFTRTPEIRALLDPLEGCVRAGDCCAADRWTAACERALDGASGDWHAGSGDAGHVLECELERFCDAEDGAEDDADGRHHGGYDDVVSFSGLSTDGARRLLALLPARQACCRQNRAPSFAELVALGERYAGMLFHGYRVAPAREDERVTLEGFYVPVECAGAVLAALAALPDEWHALTIDGRAYFRAWWD